MHSEALDRAKQVPIEDWMELREIFSGNALLTTEDGWRFLVFIDAGELDYFDTIVSPDGRTLEFDAMWDESPGNGNGPLALFFVDMEGHK